MTIFVKTVWMAVVMAFFSLTASADSFNIGLRAFNLRDYTTAMARLSEEAYRNNKIAQEMVGQFFMNGNAAPKDPFEALYWFDRAGKTVNNDKRVKALNEQGFYLPVNDGLILEKYLKQALDGDADATYRLGKVYGAGRGVKQDLLEAYNWFEKAARLGHAYAQYEVASYRYGALGVPRDMEIVMHWLKKSADNGVTLAKYYYADFLRQGLADEKDNNVIRRYYLDAANDGYGLSQFEYLQFLLPEVTNSESRIEALKWAFLSTDAWPSPRAQKMRVDCMKYLMEKGMTLKEVGAAKNRAKAFVRRNGPN